MIKYYITFIDDKTNRQFTYDDVVEMHFNISRVIMKCLDHNGQYCNLAVFSSEYTRFLMEAIDED